MLLTRDLIREFNPFHPALDATVRKVDCKPLNGYQALVFVLLFHSDGSQLFIALEGKWKKETVDCAKTFLGKTVKRCLSNRKRTAFTLVTVEQNQKDGKGEESQFSLTGILSHCINCPQTQRIDNVQ
ncbi:MAG: hypothetical protein LKK13_04565 [Bacilli bacterium]|jgi:hypothetical protein|nr:hypothetical protein [Bacilli bacterium]